MKQIERLTGRDNRRLVNARKVRDGKIERSIFIEGRRLTEEALRSDLAIEECFVADSFAESETGRPLLKAISQKTSSIAQVSDKLFGTIADTNHSQGIALIAGRPPSDVLPVETRLKSAVYKTPIAVFLNEVNNPSNLGAIIRTGEAAGVAGIVISKNSADAFSPKALRAAMGSSFRIPIWAGAGFDEVVTWAGKRNLMLTAADAKADKAFTDADWKRPRLLIFGSEAHGLSKTELTNVDEIIRIPMENGVESLNLAVSAGIILFEAKRRNP
jgi:RNA methyltransferase, TrmH family